jgi:hypothetical protein
MHLAIIFLGLIIFDEFVSNSEMIRTRRMQLKESRMVARTRRIGRKYEFQPLVA